jgi:ubiquinol-cytochrome c reductase cytochrome b subunit
MRFLYTKIIAPITAHIIDYPTPLVITYFWGFGSIAGLFLIVQLISGIFLAMHYAPNIELAFNSVEHIMRDVNNGWFLRYTHANGASMFLAVVYLHIGRGLYFQSFVYPRIYIWFSGIVIFLILVLTAFLGYVLPWGQMSLWGATVITNLASAVPYIGKSIVLWLWGGFSVDNPTLNRFFTLHFLFPFILAGLSLVHILLLHLPGSSNPLGIKATYDRISFYPYFYLKDLFGLLLIFSIFFFYSFFLFKFFRASWQLHKSQCFSNTTINRSWMVLFAVLCNFKGNTQ